LFFMSFGAIATVALMPFVALFISRLDRLFTRGVGFFRDVILAFYFVCLVYAYRGDESTAFYLPAVNIFVLLALLAMSRLRLHSTQEFDARRQP
jgi:hypothetical protein